MEKVHRADMTDEQRAEYDTGYRAASASFWDEDYFLGRSDEFWQGYNDAKELNVWHDLHPEFRK